MVHRLTLCAVLCLSACGGKSPPPVTAPAPAPKTQMRMVLAKLDSFTNQMCTCVDKPCADAIQEDVNQFSAEQAQKAHLQDENLSDEDRKRMTDLAQRYADCMTKAMTATP